MAIQAIQCEGHKAFSRRLKIDLSPITVFFGKNNSGKTTLAQLPILIAASLTSPDSLYSLSARGVTFGSSFTDLTNARDPHPSLSLGIQWSPRRRLLIQLQHVSSPEEADSVQPTFLQIDGLRRTLRLRPRPTQTPRARIDELLSPSEQHRLGERIDTLRELLNELVHIPSSRPHIHTMYAARPPAAWDVEETPYLLRSRRQLLKVVNDWFQQHLDRSGVDIDQAAFAFRLVETRDDFTVNFTHSGRGPQSALPVVTLLLAVASGMKRTPLVILEEPEAHLHPSVHGDMADLVIACSTASQLIIETHSENFLLRLRRRIADGGLSHDNVALYFIDDTHDLVRIPLDKFGATTHWPEGVFESDIEEARAIVEAKISAMANLDNVK